MAIRKGSSYKDRPAHKKTVNSRAFEHALDIELMILDRMEEMGLRKKDLAKRVGMTQSGLSNFLNGQPNMTLETMTRFEVALDAVFEIALKPDEHYEFTIDASEDYPENQFSSSDEDWLRQPFENRNFHVLIGQSESVFYNPDSVASNLTAISDKELCAA